MPHMSVEVTAGHSFEQDISILFVNENSDLGPTEGYEIDRITVDDEVTTDLGTIIYLMNDVLRITTTELTAPVEKA